MSVRSVAAIALMLMHVTGHAQSAAGIDRAAWLQGCWEQTTSTRSVEEIWTTAKGGSMIGISRTIRDGKLTAYEMVVLREDGDRLAYEAHPSGQPAATFLSTRISASEIVFENPAHDFPQQVGYRREGDALLAWIAVGLVGDTWRARDSSRTEDGSPHPDMQLNIMNARVIALLAQSDDRWPLAGDQLFLDLDLTGENLPAGTRLALGSAIIEVTPPPHTGCGKFAARFGVDATKFVNSKEGRRLHLRGINAKVVQSGTIRVGDLASKLGAPR